MYVFLSLFAVSTFYLQGIYLGDGYIVLITAEASVQATVLIFFITLTLAEFHLKLPKGVCVMRAPL